MVLTNPFPEKKDYADKAAFRAANEEVKKQRRRDLWAFTDPGMPGEARRKGGEGESQPNGDAELSIN